MAMAVSTSLSSTQIFTPSHFCSQHVAHFFLSFLTPSTNPLFERNTFVFALLDHEEKKKKKSPPDTSISPRLATTITTHPTLAACTLSTLPPLVLVHVDVSLT
ncbi:hypothetical protein VDGL01_08947 [Verticillium dahliae]